MGCGPAEVLVFIPQGRQNSLWDILVSGQGAKNDGGTKGKILNEAAPITSTCFSFAKTNHLAKTELAAPVARKRDKNTAYQSYSVRERGGD